MSTAFDEAFLKKLELLHVVARKVFAGRARAERRSRRVGAGVEFADHRAYTPGDDLRLLDWGVYGRLGRLLVRLFEEEEDLHIYLLVDASGSMTTGTPPKLDYARQVAAALAYVGLANLDRVSVVPFAADAGERLPPGRGRGRIFKVLEFLAALPALPSATTDMARALERFVVATPRRGLAVVVSDFYDARWAAGLDLLRYHRFDASVIQVVDAAEAHPAVVGDVELVDRETGEARLVTVTPRIAADVARAHEALARDLAAWCASHGIPCFRAPTETPFDELLLRVFRAGGFLG